MQRILFNIQIFVDFFSVLSNVNINTKHSAESHLAFHFKGQIVLSSPEIPNFYKTLS